MPLPTTNSYFQDGTLQGFTTEGTVRIVESFDAIHGAHHFCPVRGAHFIVLDDPSKIDGDGARKPAPGDPKPADTTRFTFTPDADNKTTLGVDGAILECRNVLIQPGQTLWFHWAFARFDWSPANDFALFVAYEDGRTDGPPAYTCVLAESLVLERQTRWFTDWQAFSWRPATPFNGTLQWIVSNGISTTLPVPRPGGNARPSALLLDCVELGQAV
jgi:hypothetical protein